MDRTLRKILIKIQSIQVGILRFITPDDEKLLFRARAGAYDGELNCVLERAGNTSLLSQSVNLIQKDKEDYLYITCKVRDEVVNSSAVI
ncbi:MAG TPA: hypothetical protein VFO70_01205, partial [Chitinophagaceae bacterium]|nr:hypothetical protein [Chitinophagaceae bacterium]